MSTAAHPLDGMGLSRDGWLQGYGAPRAVEPIHAFGMMGSRLVVQIGSCGALQEGMPSGDIVLPEQEVVGEGASQYYGIQALSRATPELVVAARAFGMRAVSLLFVWDELQRGRTWLDRFDDEERERQRLANDAVFEVALKLPVDA